MPDRMEIEVLADGTLKITTDPISPANHKVADDLLTFISKLLGGKTTRTKRRQGHQHQHHEEHQHT